MVCLCVGAGGVDQVCHQVGLLFTLFKSFVAQRCRYIGHIKHPSIESQSRPASLS